RVLIGGIGFLALVQWALQVFDCGRQWQRLSQDRVRLRAFEPGQGKPIERGRAAGVLWLEWLSAVFEGARGASQMAPNRSFVWGMGCAAGRCGWSAAICRLHGRALCARAEQTSWRLESAAAGLVL